MIIDCRRITIINKSIDMVFLDKIADVKSGLTTGDNKYYVYKSRHVEGSYKIVDHNNVLNDDEISKIRSNEKIRSILAHKGINKNMFNGKTIVPYDKGGFSDIESGRLNNYYAPTDYFIDWSEENVQRMKKLPVAKIKQLRNDPNIKELDKKVLASTFRNPDYYFFHGITFPITGLYAPTYRINSGSIFDLKGSCFFVKKDLKKYFSVEYLLGILCSKLIRYFQKNFVKNTVDSSVDDIKKNPIPLCDNSYKNKIEILVAKIIKKQKENNNYNYQRNEQIEIDEIVYKIFGLNQELIDEIENWYYRKYPKLIIKH